jgi:hypothetical protein
MPFAALASDPAPTDRVRPQYFLPRPPPGHGPCDAGSPSGGGLQPGEQLFHGGLGHWQATSLSPDNLPSACHDCWVGLQVGGGQPIPMTFQHPQANKASIARLHYAIIAVTSRRDHK